MHATGTLTAPFCVHIGLPKTATTMLQRRCFPSHPQIEYLGSQHPEPQGVSHLFRDRQVKALLDPILATPDGVEERAARKRSAAVIDEARSAGRVPLWSHEGLSNGGRKHRRLRAEALRRSVGDCTVLITLRRPRALAESVYFQYLKRHASTRASRMLRRPIYLSADRWLRRHSVSGVGLSQLDYKETIDLFVDLFGRDSVKVLLFEELVSDADAFYQRLYGAIGVDATAAPPVDQQRDNDRWTQEQIDRLRRIARNPWRSFAFRFGKRCDKMRALGLDDERRPLEPGPKPVAGFSAEALDRIDDQTRAGNRVLARDWGLPLERLGYPL